MISTSPIETGVEDRTADLTPARGAATHGWTRFGDTEHYYIPQKRFKLLAAAAFHIMAVTAGQ